MQYGRASCQVPVGKGNIGIAYTAMNHELGKELSVLDAHGTARITSQSLGNPGRASLPWLSVLVVALLGAGELFHRASEASGMESTSRALHRVIGQ